MSTGHLVRVMTADEITKYAVLGWNACAVHKCKQRHAYVTGHISDLGTRIRRRVCAMHADRFATKYGLSLPPLPQRPTDHARSLPASVIARGADTSSHGLRTSPRASGGAA